MSSARSRSTRARRAAVLVALALASACGGGAGDDDGDDGEVDAGVPLFPADYADSFVEVRGCRASADHLLDRIRVLADPAALAPYQDRDDAFPEGAVVLKEEYDPTDLACEGEIVRWTVMVRLPEGASSDTLDWRWQDLDGERAVVSQDDVRCYGCHSSCGRPPDGHDGTCAVP
jgi:hypothetical protein